MKLLKVRPTMLKRWNFSMIEIMATIAIITILAGLSFGAYRGIQKGQAKAKTEATVNAIHVALQAFKTKYGYYPQAPFPVSSPQREFGVALVFCKEKLTTGDDNVSSGVILNGGTRLVLGKDFTKFLGSEVMKNAVIQDGNIGSDNVYILVEGYKDPVANCDLLKNVATTKKAKLKANLLFYRCPGYYNQESYDLFSAGPDRKLWTDDDIWPQGLKRSPSNE